MEKLKKSDYKFMDRHEVAIYMACKSCEYCKQNVELSYVVGNIPDSKNKFCDLSFDTKYKLVLKYRQDCSYYEDVDERGIERDTTYPGATFAPTDNNNPLIMRDSTQIDYDPYAEKRCINQLRIAEPTPVINNWDKCLELIFDRKRINWELKDSRGNKILLKHKDIFPTIKIMLELLNSSFIPQFTFKIGLPPTRSMGIERGLWFYKSEKFNTMLDHNKPKLSEMTKYIMVYLYNIWFKRIERPNTILVDSYGIAFEEPEELRVERERSFKTGVILALDGSKIFSVGKSLNWWMVSVFKDELAIQILGKKDEKDDTPEEIPMSLLAKAEQAFVLNELQTTNEELDEEVQQYEYLLDTIGRLNKKTNKYQDRHGKEILY